MPKEFSLVVIIMNPKMKRVIELIMLNQSPIKACVTGKNGCNNHSHRKRGKMNIYNPKGLEIIFFITPLLNPLLMLINRGVKIKENNKRYNINQR